MNALISDKWESIRKQMLDSFSIKKIWMEKTLLDKYIYIYIASGNKVRWEAGVNFSSAIHLTQIEHDIFLEIFFICFPLKIMKRAFCDLFLTSRWTTTFALGTFSFYKISMKQAVQNEKKEEKLSIYSKCVDLSEINQILPFYTLKIDC